MTELLDPKPRPRRRPVLRSLLSLALVGTVVLGFGFVLFAESLERHESSPTQHADGMVVLTGGADRVSDAIELFAAGHADRLLITGVNPSTSRETLERLLPSVHDLIACCVDLGYQALNTSGNASEAATWVRANAFKSLIVVTSNYHMPRALALIGEALPDVTLEPYPVVSDRAKAVIWWSDEQRVRLIALEYLKYVAVLARKIVLPRGSQGGPSVVANRSG